ncbi:hypothetical protein GLYMA_18G175750v4 [Glycine max]|nr:hypothetical protein GLYMA_18G175750v4 [Glycine max]KAH1154932.1 hypothetical protein GYH30_050288 [Glycine max]
MQHFFFISLFIYMLHQTRVLSHHYMLYQHFCLSPKKTSVSSKILKA